MMERVPNAFWPALLLGLAFALSGCDSGSRTWVPPQEEQVTIISDAAFVRTGQGDFVDGYLAEYQTDFKKRRMFMSLEIPHYLKGDRLIVTGRLTGDSVRLSSGAENEEKIPVFQVERARPNVPTAPDIPALK